MQSEPIGSGFFKVKFEYLNKAQQTAIQTYDCLGQAGVNILQDVEKWLAQNPGSYVQYVNGEVGGHANKTVSDACFDLYDQQGNKVGHFDFYYQEFTNIQSNIKSGTFNLELRTPSFRTASSPAAQQPSSPAAQQPSSPAAHEI